MKRGGRLVVGIGCAILAVVVALWGRAQTLYVTEGEAFALLWPAWFLVVALAIAAVWLLRGVR